MRTYARTLRHRRYGEFMLTFVRRYLSRGIINTGTYPGRKVRMTEITAPKSPVTAEQFADEIREQLKYTQNVTTEQATPADVYVAASKAVRNHLADSWSRPSRHRERQHQGSRLPVRRIPDGQAAAQRAAQRRSDRAVRQGRGASASRSRTSSTPNTSRASATAASAV
mgnify:CR=1 FL=1